MDFISFFLKLQNQLQILHWQTRSYAKHKAYGMIYEESIELVDKFIEVFQGKYKRLEIDTSNPIQLQNIADDSLNFFISDAINVLENDITSILSEKDTDLLNIRDEILGLLNKLKYLLTLN